MGEPMGAGGAADALRASIAALWEEGRPIALARVETIEDAVAALMAGALDDALREAARQEAHRLAGSLGTFGIPEGTVAAAALEQGLMQAPALADVPSLAAHALALRRAVEGSPGEAEPQAGGGARVVLAGLPSARAAELIAAARGTDWRIATSDGAPDAGAADVVLLGAGVPEAAATAATLAGAGVAVAATDDAGDRVALVRAGARRLLPATLAPHAVIDELADLERGHRAATATIIAVDDDPIALALMGAALERAGHRFIAVEDPLAFWAALEVGRPDLVVLDVQLPGTDGTELCRTLRASPRWRGLPVLFLTASTDARTVAELFAAGGDDYVPKPVDGRELVARIEGRLERTDQLGASAELDPQTGLRRWSSAAPLLAGMVAAAERLRQPLTVAAVRVDGLDERRDAGDALSTGAAALRESLGPADVPARGPGGELVVGMLGLDAHDARERLGELVEAVRRRGAQTGGVTLSAGVAEYPAHGRDVDELVAAAATARRAAEAAGGDRVTVAGTAGGEPDRVDVALVEDDEVLARLVRHALETRGYRVRWIADGDEACRGLGGAAPPVRADLVLLDWDLPGRDGLTVLRLLAADGVLDRSRVVMLTMRASEREALTALELGATDHIAKPFSVPLLMQRVRRVLAR